MRKKLMFRIISILTCLIMIVFSSFVVSAVCSHGNYNPNTNSYSAHGEGSCNLGVYSYTHDYTVSTVPTHGGTVNGCFYPYTSPTSNDASITLSLARFVFSESNDYKISPFYYMYGQHSVNASSNDLGTHEGVDIQHHSSTSTSSPDNCNIYSPITGTVVACNKTAGRLHINSNDGQTKWIFMHLDISDNIDVSSQITKGLTVLGNQDDYSADAVHLHVQIQSDRSTGNVETGRDDVLGALSPYSYFVTSLVCYHTSINSYTGNCNNCGSHRYCVNTWYEQIIGTVDDCYLSYAQCNGCSDISYSYMYGHSFSGSTCTKCGFNNGSGGQHTHSYSYQDMAYQYEQNCCYIYGWRCSCGEFWNGGTSVQHLCYPYGGRCAECEEYWYW